MREDSGSAQVVQVDKIFVIGGVSVYRAAMDIDTRKVRVLQTLVRRKDAGKIDVDTFFSTSDDQNDDESPISGVWCTPRIRAERS